MDNSALMRNIRRHEHTLEGAIVGICRALLAAGAAVRVALCAQGGATPSRARNGAETGGLRASRDGQRWWWGVGSSINIKRARPFSFLLI